MPPGQDTTPATAKSPRVQGGPFSGTGVFVDITGKTHTGLSWSIFRDQIFRWNIKEKSPLVPLVQFFCETNSL